MVQTIAAGRLLPGAKTIAGPACSRNARTAAIPLKAAVGSPGKICGSPGLRMWHELA
jgi:hypothetical protein